MGAQHRSLLLQQCLAGFGQSPLGRFDGRQGPGAGGVLPFDHGFARWQQRLAPQGVGGMALAVQHSLTGSLGLAQLACAPTHLGLQGLYLGLDPGQASMGCVPARLAALAEHGQQRTNHGSTPFSASIVAFQGR